MHKLNRQPEQSPCLIANHLQVIVFGWTGQRVTPEEIHALPTMQVAELVGVDLYGF